MTEETRGQRPEEYLYNVIDNMIYNFENLDFGSEFDTSIYVEKVLRAFVPKIVLTEQVKKIQELFVFMSRQGDMVRKEDVLQILNKE